MLQWLLSRVRAPQSWVVYRRSRPSASRLDPEAVHYRLGVQSPVLVLLAVVDIR
jgi:hypothetical protein